MKTEPTERIFYFYEGYKLTGRFGLTQKELVAQFTDWLKQNDEWRKYNSIYACLNVFLREHLNVRSCPADAVDFMEYCQIGEILNPVYSYHLNETN